MGGVEKICLLGLQCHGLPGASLGLHSLSSTFSKRFLGFGKRFVWKPPLVWRISELDYCLRGALSEVAAWSALGLWFS